MECFRAGRMNPFFGGEERDGVGVGEGVKGLHQPPPLLLLGM